MGSPPSRCSLKIHVLKVAFDIWEGIKTTLKTASVQKSPPSVGLPYMVMPRFGVAVWFWGDVRKADCDSCDQCNLNLTLHRGDSLRETKFPPNPRLNIQWAQPC